MIRPVVLAIAAAVTLGACGASESSICTELREPADPASILHVVDATTAVFLTDPPTSGPHVSGLLPVGVINNPIDPAIQVSILESGAALVQYGPEVNPTDVALIAEIAGPLIVVAPGIGLPAPVVATAWTWKLTCSSIDLPAIDKFVRSRPADAPGAD